MTERRRTFYVCALLSAVILVLYSHVFRCQFLVFDDDSHVTANPCVKDGLSLQSIGWGFTHFIGCQWIPLTWISHALDVTIFGLDPGWHHLVNVGFHALNACLVLLALRSLTGEFWPSAAVAALFAVHPINVESVAWIAERKNVLSTAFWLLATCCYARHVKEPGRRWMWAVAACMALGLLAKPMLVTLPFALLLLDFWPLGRAGTVPWRRLLWEKSLLFLLSIISSGTTVAAAAHGSFLAKPAVLPVSQRIANAAIGYCAYLEKLLWPQHLAILYPFRIDHPLAQVLGSLLALGCVTALCLALRRRMPFLLIGWLWFLGTLVPVSGILQVGAQAYADRFSYVPQLGIFIAIVWATRALPQPALRWAAVAGVSVAAVLGMLTVLRVGDWTDTVTIFESSLSVTEENLTAHANAGMGWLRRGGYPEALAHFRAAEKMNPNDSGIELLLGESLAHQGEYTEALDHLRKAVTLDPSDEHARRNLIVLLVNQGRQQEAARWIKH